MTSPPPAPVPAAPPAPDGAVRVLVCDDSAVIRSAISAILERDPRIRVVARAADGAQAVALARQVAPDVVVLDIEMPVMDGLAALPLLLAHDPGLRVIMASTLTTRGADIALRALRLGAADCLPKPTSGDADHAGFAAELLARVRGLARLRRPAPAAPAARAAHPPAPPPARRPALLAIGASTGGPQALFALVEALGPDLPVPVVLTQHMPATFTPLLARHLTRLGAMPCDEAVDGAPLLPGRIALAPGNRHLLVRNDRGALRSFLSDAPPENHCRPAVDAMLRSACEACDGAVLVVMLTGMGQDGLAGTAQVVGAGGCAIAQDAATSVVWGMPGAIARAGLAHAVLPLPGIAPRVLQMLAAPPPRPEPPSQPRPAPRPAPFRPHPPAPSPPAHAEPRPPATAPTRAPPPSAVPR